MKILIDMNLSPLSEIERFGLFFENSFIYLRFNSKKIKMQGAMSLTSPIICRIIIIHRDHL